MSLRVVGIGGKQRPAHQENIVGRHDRADDPMPVILLPAQLQNDQQVHAADQHAEADPQHGFQRFLPHAAQAAHEIREEDRQFHAHGDGGDEDHVPHILLVDLPLQLPGDAGIENALQFTGDHVHGPFPFVRDGKCFSVQKQVMIIPPLNMRNTV